MNATYGGIALTGTAGVERIGPPVELPGSAQVDVVAGVRAACVRPIPRGNRETRPRVRYWRQFGTYLLAAAAAARLAETLPAQGPLVLSETGAGAELVMIYPDACLSTWDPVASGAGFQVDLTFICGRPPSVSETVPPGVAANWEAWDEANWENLDRFWFEEQRDI